MRGQITKGFTQVQPGAGVADVAKILLVGVINVQKNTEFFLWFKNAIIFFTKLRKELLLFVDSPKENSPIYRLLSL